MYTLRLNKITETLATVTGSNIIGLHVVQFVYTGPEIGTLNIGHFFVLHLTAHKMKQLVQLLLASFSVLIDI